MARKKVKENIVTGELWDLENTPWGAHAAHLVRQEGLSFSEARDVVILHYLHLSGDIEPLKALFSLGESPGPKVLIYLANMMNDLPDLKMSFALVVESRDGTKRSEGSIRWRNLMIANLIHQRYEAGEKYDAAVAAEAEALGLSFEHVRKIYDKAKRDGVFKVKCGD